MATLTFEPRSVPLRIDDTGTVRVAATRVTLDSVLTRHREGLSPEQILECYPTLLLSDIREVIEFCDTQRDMVDAYMAEREREGDEIEAAWRAAWDVDAYAQSLIDRREGTADNASPVG